MMPINELLKNLSKPARNEVREVMEKSEEQSFKRIKRIKKEVNTMYFGEVCRPNDLEMTINYKVAEILSELVIHEKVKFQDIPVPFRFEDSVLAYGNRVARYQVDSFLVYIEKLTDNIVLATTKSKWRGAYLDGMLKSLYRTFEFNNHIGSDYYENKMDEITNKFLIQMQERNVVRYY